MTTLDPDKKYFTVINTFTAEPENVDQLLRDLVGITERYVHTQPGFVSANFHISADRKTVINYAQWRSKDDAGAMLADPAGQEDMRRATALATNIDPVFCHLIWTSAKLG